MAGALDGCRVALLEGRQLEDLVRLLEREGAVAIRCPLLAIADVADPGPVAAWLRELADGRLDWVIFLTGEGVRRLLGFAEREGLRDPVLRALAASRIVTRGPKPVQALKELGLSPTLVADAPTTAGVISSLQGHDLRNRTVGVQLYDESNPALTEFLEQAGATVRAVRPYVYTPRAENDQVARLVEEAAEGELHFLVFTSSPQVDRFFEVIAGNGLEARWQGALGRFRVAAVGPLVAENLRRRGTPVAVCPDQGFVMKNLVQQIKKAWQEGTPR